LNENYCLIQMLKIILFIKKTFCPKLRPFIYIISYWRESPLFVFSRTPCIFVDTVSAVEIVGNYIAISENKNLTTHTIHK